MDLSSLAFNYPHQKIKNCLVVNADCFEWLAKLPDESIHAVVTDPPYGIREFEQEHVDHIKDGDAVWQTFRYGDGSNRVVQPCFTMTEKERKKIPPFFTKLSKEICRVLKPGGHLIIAGHSSLTTLVFPAIEKGGLQFRASIIRIVWTLRGGDRPPGAQEEFHDCCTLPKSGHEPWGLFRKPLPKGMGIPDCLRQYKTGALRRVSEHQPFMDLLSHVSRPTKAEIEIGNHPNLKPQKLMRLLTKVVLPLEEGIIVDPFMGSGSTVAASIFNKYECIGIEKNTNFYQNSIKSIPQLAVEKPFRNENDAPSPVFL
jgi:site-specific DNA-methyltransferase (adenine-specific)